MIFAHLGGVPLEETLLGLAPLGVSGVGLLTLTVRLRARAWRRRHRRRAQPEVSQRSRA